MNLVQKKKIDVHNTPLTRESNKSFLYCEKDESVIAMCVINLSPRSEREIIQDLCDATKKRCVHGRKIAFSLIKLRIK